MTVSKIEAITYKNTTHQNITIHYLEFIFLNRTAVMPTWLFLLPFDVSVSFSSHLHGGKESDLVNVILYYTHILIFTQEENCWNFN